MKRLLSRLLDHRPLLGALLSLLPLACGLLAASLYQASQEANYLLDMDRTTATLASNLESETLNGQVIAVAALLGRNEPLLQTLAKGQGSDDDPAVLLRLQAARQQLGAAGIYVIDRAGLVRAHETLEASKTTGRNVAWRPYFQQAIQGRNNIYAAVGSRSGERGLYFAAPLHDGSASGAPIIGVILIKMSGDFLDRKLAAAGHRGILLAPQGVIFAATEPAWLLHLVGEASADRLELLKAQRQFGKDFKQADTVRTLDFDLHQRVSAIQGRDHGFSRSALEWNDPAGRWSLIQFDDLSLASDLRDRLMVGLAVALASFILLRILLGAARSSRMRYSALAAQKAAVAELTEATRLKEYLAELTVHMQEAESAEQLVEVFFQQLARRSAIHQGSLYAILGETEDADLERIGLYGTDQAPQRIAINQGLLAQCGRTGRKIQFNDPPPGFWRIDSGLIDAMPRALLMFPLLRNQRLLGVLELASLQPLEELDTTLIESLLPLLAINLDDHLTRQRNRARLAACQDEIARLSQILQSHSPPPQPAHEASDNG